MMGFADTEIALTFDPPLKDGGPPPWFPDTVSVPAGQLVEVFPASSSEHCKCAANYGHDKKCPWSWGGWVKLVDGEYAGWWAVADDVLEDFPDIASVTALELLAREGEDPPDE
jgi:hypothetical protein